MARITVEIDEVGEGETYSIIIGRPPEEYVIVDDDPGEEAEDHVEPPKTLRVAGE